MASSDLPPYAADPDPAGPLADALAAAHTRLRRALDAAAPHVAARWGALLLLVCLYALRAYCVRGFHIVSYGLAIYNLNLLLGFITPRVDPDADAPGLPTAARDEFRPFDRRLPEFKAWWASVRAFAAGLVATLFPVLDVPVFWPILVFYFCALFAVTMKRQIRHMIKHRYVPFSLGKKRYGGGKGGGGGAVSRPVE